jgi:DNA-binding LytR/AlgR family response regulator
MRVAIVDDEKPAREELIWLLEQSGEDIEIIGQAATAAQAQDLIKQVAEDDPIDLVFLDIDMPGVDGMRLAELWQDRPGAPLVVFVTAYEHHAVNAFAVDAVDYLLKPVRMDRLQRALKRAHTRAATSAAVTVQPLARPLSRISVEERGVYRVIPIDDILFFESEDGIVVVQTRDARYITDFSLKFLEQNLDPQRFFRCHRSYIVRIDAITSIAPWGAGTYRLVLDATKDLGVPLARARAADLKAIIPWSAAIFEE